MQSKASSSHTSIHTVHPMPQFIRRLRRLQFFGHRPLAPAHGRPGQGCTAAADQIWREQRIRAQGSLPYGRCDGAVGGRERGGPLRAPSLTPKQEYHAHLLNALPVLGPPQEYVEECLSDVSGQWNLQADAPLTHFMDFSDYYVLPESCLPSWWKMSEHALGACARRASRAWRSITTTVTPSVPCCRRRRVRVGAARLPRLDVPLPGPRQAVDGHGE